MYVVTTSGDNICKDHIHHYADAATLGWHMPTQTCLQVAEHALPQCFSSTCAGPLRGCLTSCLCSVCTCSHAKRQERWEETYRRVRSALISDNANNRKVAAMRRREEAWQQQQQRRQELEQQQASMRAADRASRLRATLTLSAARSNAAGTSGNPCSEGGAASAASCSTQDMQHQAAPPSLVDAALKGPVLTGPNATGFWLSAAAASRRHSTAAALRAAAVGHQAAQDAPASASNSTHQPAANTPAAAQAAAVQAALGHLKQSSPSEPQCSKPGELSKDVKAALSTICDAMGWQALSQWPAPYDKLFDSGMMVTKECVRKHIDNNRSKRRSTGTGAGASTAATAEPRAPASSAAAVGAAAAAAAAATAAAAAAVQASSSSDSAGGLASAQAVLQLQLQLQQAQPPGALAMPLLLMQQHLLQQHLRQAS